MVGDRCVVPDKSRWYMAGTYKNLILIDLGTL
jgi:hypothetical protein